MLVKPLLAAWQGGLGEGLGSVLILLVPLLAVWYFLLILPQQRQKRKTQEMLESLKTGDRVLTSGGIYGTIAGFRGDVIQLLVANQVRIDVARTAITGVQPSEKEKESGEAAKGKN